MVKSVKNKILQLRMKLLKAWTRGKEKKAVKLQHKILEKTLKDKTTSQ